jgi:hypothetical protein
MNKTCGIIPQERKASEHSIWRLKNEKGHNLWYL